MNNQSINEGYLPLWRKFFKHPFWTEKRVFSKAEAWIDILANTQYEIESKQRLIRGEVVVQNYGECVMSTRYCGDRWGWTQSRVSRFLKSLENMEQITQNSTHRHNVITVINFETYNKRNSFFDSQATHRRLTGDSQATQSKEGKEGKEIYTSPFLIFWEAYPKKVGKGAAFKAWKAALKNMPDNGYLLSALENQKNSPQWKKNNGQYIPNPQTWLNQRRWEDGITIVSNDQKWRQAF